MITAHRFSAPIAVGLAVGVAALAALLPRFTLFLVGQLAILIIVTAALVILMAGAGLLAMSSAAFLGIGAYGAVILVDRLQVPFPIAILVMAAVGAIVGWLLGLVSLRLSGFYLAIMTLGFLLILKVVLTHGGDITGNGYGVIAPLVTLPIVGTLTSQSFALLAIFLAVVVIYGGSALMRSRFGRGWLALRDHAPAALMQGINVRAAKLRAFATTSAIIAGAGAVYAWLLGSASPTSFGVSVSIFHIALVVVGGLTGGMAGAVIAPVLLFLLPALFNGLGPYTDLLYASILLVVLVFFRDGIDGAFSRGVRAIRRVRAQRRTVK